MDAGLRVLPELRVRTFLLNAVAKESLGALSRLLSSAALQSSLGTHPTPRHPSARLQGALPPLSRQHAQVTAVGLGAGMSLEAKGEGSELAGGPRGRDHSFWRPAALSRITAVRLTPPPTRQHTVAERRAPGGAVRDSSARSGVLWRTQFQLFLVRLRGGGICAPSRCPGFWERQSDGSTYEDPEQQGSLAVGCGRRPRFLAVCCPLVSPLCSQHSRAWHRQRSSGLDDREKPGLISEVV